MPASTLTFLTRVQFDALASAARGPVRVIAPGWPQHDGDIAYDVVRSLVGTRPPLLALAQPADADPATMAVGLITAAGRRAVARVA